MLETAWDTLNGAVMACEVGGERLTAQGPAGRGHRRHATGTRPASAGAGHAEPGHHPRRTDVLLVAGTGVVHDAVWLPMGLANE